MNSIVRRMTEIRKQKGLSQSALEREMGVGRSSVSLWERGMGNPSPENLKKIEKWINSTVVLTSTPKPKPVKDETPDKFGPGKNHEGYSDPTAAAAMRTSSNGATAVIGEVWLQRRNNGSVVSKLIISNVSEAKFYVISLFRSNVGISNLTKTKVYSYDITKIEIVKGCDLDRRIDLIPLSTVEEIKADISEKMGLVGKEIIKEVPVEKEVIKEVIKESDPTELLLAKQRADIYEDAFNKVVNFSRTVMS